MTLRLDRLLVAAGWGSRTEMQKAVKSGRVYVDGVPSGDPARKIDSACQRVEIDGQDADYRPFDYIMMHKPAGVVSVTEDPKEPTVIGLLPPRYQRRGLFPAGRLDKDTTGLLILTNDGDMGHRLTAPGKGVPRVYEAVVDGPMYPEDVKAFADGLVLPGGEICRPALLEIVSSDELSRIFITIFEGKYHQVKRMAAARGRNVLSLKRLAHGALRLDDSLPPGAWRSLTPAEYQCLFTLP